MNGIFGIIVFVVINHALGIVVGITIEEKIRYERCVKANSAMAANEIIDYCEKRLYLKEDK